MRARSETQEIHVGADAQGRFATHRCVAGQVYTIKAYSDPGKTGTHRPRATLPNVPAGSKDVVIRVP